MSCSILLWYIQQLQKRSQYIYFFRLIVLFKKSELSEVSYFEGMDLLRSDFMVKKKYQPYFPKGIWLMPILLYFFRWSFEILKICDKTSLSLNLSSKYIINMNPYTTVFQNYTKLILLSALSFRSCIPFVPSQLLVLITFFIV